MTYLQLMMAITAGGSCLSSCWGFGSRHLPKSIPQYIGASELHAAHSAASAFHSTQRNTVVYAMPAPLSSPTNRVVLSAHPQCRLTHTRGRLTACYGGRKCAPRLPRMDLAAVHTTAAASHHNIELHHNMQLKH